MLIGARDPMLVFRNEMDGVLGRILAAVKAAGVDENTISFFSSDNGPWLIHKLNGGSAGTLRDGKTTTWWVVVVGLHCVMSRRRKYGVNPLNSRSLCGQPSAIDRPRHPERGLEARARGGGGGRNGEATKGSSGVVPTDRFRPGPAVHRFAVRNARACEHSTVSSFKADMWVRPHAHLHAWHTRTTAQGGRDPRAWPRAVAGEDHAGAGARCRGYHLRHLPDRHGACRGEAAGGPGL